MKRLYVGVANFGEIYTAFLHSCSLDKEKAENAINDWCDENKSYGNDASCFLDEIQITDELAEYLLRGASLNVINRLTFKVAWFDDGKNDEFDGFYTITKVLGLTHNSDEDEDGIHICEVIS